MGTPVEINPLQLGAGGYTIGRSVRFRSSASAYLNRTPASTTNRKTYTISLWSKRGALGSSQYLISAGNASTNECAIRFNADNTFEVEQYTSPSFNYQLVTTQVFRDPSAWYHFVVAVDTTQATSSNRIKVYVNGVQVTAFNTTSYPSLNYDTNFNLASYTNQIGAWNTNYFFDGYLAEVNFIDGQALTPSSFGAYDTNGVWQPKAYTGTYGTNGFYLKFTDNSAATAAAIGKDYSGNGNNWTPNNISVTAGVTYDSMIDSPTVGYAASNYCVLNPIFASATGISNGNLTATGTARGTMNITQSSTNWYWEVTASSAGVSAGAVDSGGTYTTTVSNGTTMAFRLNQSGTSLQYSTDGVNWTTLTGGFAADAYPYVTGGTTNVNFGQRPFTYTPSSGYKSLNTYNLPAATINNGATVMAASTYTANGGVQTVLNSANNAASVSFQPDLFWIKPRSAVGSNILANTIVGVSKYVYSDQAVSEVTNANYITSANSNGFSLGSANYAAGTTMVGWQWQAGQGTTSSNTNGSITSTVSVNLSAGFSIVTYTGTLSGTPGTMPTVGHGLGVAPKLVISKSRNVAGVDSGAWFVWSANTGSTDYYLRLNTTAAVASVSGGGGGTMVAPTSTVFSTPYISGANISANNYVAYCWSEVAGYSKFGSYTGNGSADGPFVYCGFRPRFILFKITNAVGNWFIRDTSRDTYNASTQSLYPNLSDAEFAGGALDILSNGFKPRASTGGINGSGETIIFAAFAENPFNISRAR